MLTERMQHQHHMMHIFFSFIILKGMIQVDSMKSLLLEDHLRIHDIDGKYTEPVFLKHMLKSAHGEHREYDSHSSTMLLSG